LVIFFGHISKNNKDTLQSLPLNVRDQTLMHVLEENKRKKIKENETKEKKRKETKVR
jgi:hypothetical protein